MSELPPEAPKDRPNPKVEVEEKARELIARETVPYTDLTVDSRHDVPREAMLTFEPDFENITFAPERHDFLWKGEMYWKEFNMHAPASLEGAMVRGCMRVYLGPLILSEIDLSIKVDTASARAQQAQNEALERASASSYRRLFASYSHKDEFMVLLFEDFAEALGDEYLRDVRDIRSGEVWDERIKELIRNADLFQLFWSSNSMRSVFVKQEWEYALSLKRDFMRITYWEEPMPSDPEMGLPPDKLRRLQFKKYRVRKEQPRKKKLEPRITTTIVAVSLVAILIGIYWANIRMEYPSAGLPNVPPAVVNTNSSSGPAPLYTEGGRAFGSLRRKGDTAVYFIRLINRDYSPIVRIRTSIRLPNYLAPILTYSDDDRMGMKPREALTWNKRERYLEWEVDDLLSRIEQKTNRELRFEVQLVRDLKPNEAIEFEAITIYETSDGEVYSSVVPFE